MKNRPRLSPPRRFSQSAMLLTFLAAVGALAVIVALSRLFAVPIPQVVAFALFLPVCLGAALAMQSIEKRGGP